MPVSRIAVAVATITAAMAVCCLDLMYLAWHAHGGLSSAFTLLGIVLFGLAATFAVTPSARLYFLVLGLVVIDCGLSAAYGLSRLSQSWPHPYVGVGWTAVTDWPLASGLNMGLSIFLTVFAGVVAGLALLAALHRMEAASARR